MRPEEPAHPLESVLVNSLRRDRDLRSLPVVVSPRGVRGRSRPLARTLGRALRLSPRAASFLRSLCTGTASERSRFD